MFFISKAQNVQDTQKVDRVRTYMESALTHQTLKHSSYFNPKECGSLLLMLTCTNCIALYTGRITNPLPKELTYRRDSAGRRSLRRSRSSNVTDYGTNRKPVGDFLLVNNNNLHPISQRLPYIAQ